MTPPSQPPLVTAFRSLPYLSGRDREQILQLSQELSFSADQVLLRQGGATGEFILLIEGQAAVQIETAAGPREVGLLGPGDLVGEMSFITGEPASASVVGKGDGTMLRVPHSVLDGLCQEGGFGTRLYQSLALLLAQRLRQTSARANLPPQ